MTALAGCTILLLLFVTVMAIWGFYLTFGVYGLIGSTCFMAIVWVVYLGIGVKKENKNG